MTLVQGRTFSLPVDYDRQPEYLMFVGLLAECEDEDQARLIAAHVFLRLWQEFAYYSTVAPLGCIPKDDFPFVLSRILFGAPQDSVERCTKYLLRSGLLTQDEKYYFARKFYWVNQHLEERYRSSNTKGREIQIYNHRKRKYIAQQEKEPLHFPEHWSFVDGQKVAPLLMNRAIVVVRMMDAILHVPERVGMDFSQGLVTDAVKFVFKFKPVQIDLILQKLMSRRDEPQIPRAAELVFSNLESVLHALDLPDLGNYARIMENEMPPNPAEQTVE